MYSVAAVRDMHVRAHRSMERLIRHCGQLTTDELNREIIGFGYPTVRLQLEHMVGAEEYWVRVIRGRFDENEADGEFPTLAAIESYRLRVAEETDEFLRSSTDEDLNEPREMLTWPKKLRTLTPAHIIVRTLTHIYQHQGQVLAMCRIIDRPAPAGLDFPLD